MKHARIMIVIAALLWATGGTAIKLAHQPAPILAGGRALIAGVLIFLLVPETRIRPNGRVAIVAIAYALVSTLFVFANTYTTAGNAIFIQNIAPVWVMLASPWLLGEHPSRIEKISVPICLFGCALFFLDDPELGMFTGNAIAFVSGLAYAAVVIAWRKSSRAEGLAGTAWGNLLITAAMLPLVDFSGLDRTGALAILYLGSVQQALPAILFIRGVRGVSALEASLFTLLEPVFSPVLAYLVVGEMLGPLSIAGAATILAATVWRIRAARTAGDLTGGEPR